MSARFTIYIALPLEAEYEQDEDGKWIVSVPHLKGCVSQGNTLEEAFKNLEEAAIGCIQSIVAGRERESEYVKKLEGIAYEILDNILGPEEF